VNKVEASLQEIRSFIENSKSVTSALSVEGDNLRLRSRLQIFFDKKYRDKSTAGVYQTLLAYASKAETTSAGAGIQLLKLVAGAPYESNAINAINAINGITRDRIEEKLFFVGLRKREVDMFLLACDMSSLTGKLSVVKSRSLASFVEATDGYVFSLPVLLKQTGLYRNATVLCIDGYVENISEIHHILEYLAENKETCMLFVRGLSDDVLNTIKVNNDRGIFKIIPIRVPFDVDNANTMVDIAVVCGTDVTSSLKGDLMSAIDMKKSPAVDEISIRDAAVVIKNRRTAQRVEDHVQNLKKMIQDRPEIESILSKRYRSLTSSHVTIYLSNDAMYEATRQKFDEVIRWLSHALLCREDATEVAKRHYEHFMSTIESCTAIV